MTTIDSQELVLYFRDEINKLRQNPKSIVPRLHDREARFTEDNVYVRPDISSISYRTQEGVQSVTEAVNYLQGVHPLHPIELSLQLCEAAYFVGLQMSSQHRQSTPSRFQAKIISQLQKIGCKVQLMDVIVQYGFRKDKQILPTILIDDGDRSRTRRNAIMSPDYNYMGISIHQHQEFDYLLLILLAEKVEREIKEPQSKCEVM